MAQRRDHWRADDQRTGPALSARISDDPYTDPASGVLHNILGITDPNALAEAEAAITQANIARLDIERLPGLYDLQHLQAFHRRIFGDIYPWAGEIRTVAIAKTHVFCLPQHIEAYARDVFDKLCREDHLKGLPRDVFVERLTHFYAEINAIHPFREGNGRTQRAFFRQLADEAGYRLDWRGIEAERNTQASIASLRGDNAPMQAMLDGLVMPVRNTNR